MNTLSGKKIIFQTILSLGALLFATPYVCWAESSAFRVTPFAGVSEMYNDNITFEKDDTVSDFVTSLTAGLVARYETRLSAVQLQGNLHYNIFASHDEFSNVSGDIAAEWKQELSKYDRFVIRENYIHTDEPVSFVDAFNTRAGRFTFQMNRIALNYEHDFSSQWAGTARYANEIALFSTDLFRNTSLNTGGVGMIYHFSSKLDVLVDYDYEVRDFEDGASATDHIISMGIRKYITPTFYLDGKLGMDFIDAYNGESLSEPRFEAIFTNEINQTTILELALEKKYSLNSYVEDVFDHWQISSSLKKQWTERMRTSLAVFFGSGQYETSHTENELIGANISMGYDLTKQCQLTLKYVFTSVSSTDSSLEYQKNVIFAGLTWNF